jgi:hypothetical protein
MTMTPRRDGRHRRALPGVAGRFGHHRPHLPAGDIAKTSPAAKYLVSKGVQPIDFNSYGARRGNHEVMMRGTSPTSACATCSRRAPKVA